MSKQLRFTMLPIAILALMGIFFMMQPHTAQAGGCNFLKTAILEEETLHIVKVPNVGNNRIIVEIAGEGGSEYRIQIGGSSITGMLDENGNSQRILRNYAENIGTIPVAIASLTGEMSYAIDTANCDDIDSPLESDKEVLLDDTDDLIISEGEFGAAYFDEIGIYVYRLDENGIGELALTIPTEELADFPTCPDENTIIAISEDELFSISRVVSCNYQISMGPDDEGKTEVIVFESLETIAEDVDRAEFFLPES